MRIAILPCLLALALEAIGFERVLALNPRDVKSTYQLADIWMQRGEFAKAQAAFDAHFLGWAPAYLDASQQFEQFRPDRIPPKGLETSYYSNTTVTDLVTKAAAEVDQQKRKDEYCQAAKQVWTDAPWIFLYNQSFPIVYSAKVTGVGAFPNEKFDTRFAAPA